MTDDEVRLVAERLLGALAMYASDGGDDSLLDFEEDVVTVARAALAGSEREAALKERVEYLSAQIEIATEALGFIRRQSGKMMVSTSYGTIADDALNQMSVMEPAAQPQRRAEGAP